MSELPEIWWSPSRAAENKGVSPYAGMLWRYESGRGYITPPNLPADAVRVTFKHDPAPIDWPARFRAAASVAEQLGRPEVEVAMLLVVAAWARSAPSDVVEAIGRALLADPT
jgi:hypothetical protein